MNTADWVGSIGVTVTLIAFLLNLAKKLTQDSFIYIFCNLVGGSLTCAASVLVHYYPFVVLEAVWSIVSFIALINYFLKKRNI